MHTAHETGQAEAQEFTEDTSSCFFSERESGRLWALGGNPGSDCLPQTWCGHRRDERQRRGLRASRRGRGHAGAATAEASDERLRTLSRGSLRRTPLPTATVSPAELRAIGSRPTSTHIVVLPFDHPLHPQPGRERQSAGAPRAAHRRRSNTTSPKLPACRTSVSALMRLIDRARIAIARQPRVGRDTPADPEQAIERRPGGRRRLDVEPIERIDQPHQLAARRRRRHQAQQHARARRTTRGPTISDSCPRGNPPPSRDRPARARRVAPAAASSACSGGGERRGQRAVETVARRAPRSELRE